MQDCELTSRRSYYLLLHIDLPSQQSRSMPVSDSVHACVYSQDIDHNEVTGKYEHILYAYVRSTWSTATIAVDKDHA